MLPTICSFRFNTFQIFREGNACANRLVNAYFFVDMTLCGIHFLFAFLKYFLRLWQTYTTIDFVKFLVYLSIHMLLDTLRKWRLTLPITASFHWNLLSRLLQLLLLTSFLFSLWTFIIYFRKHALTLYPYQTWRK